MKVAWAACLAGMLSCGGAGTGTDAALVSEAGVPRPGTRPDVAADRSPAIVDAPGPRPREAGLPVDAPALDSPSDRGGSPDGVAEVALPAGPAWSMGYYAGYDVGRLAVADIPWRGLTHVAAAFYFPRADGSIDETFYQGSLAEGQALGHALVTAAHAHGRKAVASLGGAGSQAGFRSAMTGPARDAFVRSIVSLAAEYGYDGIDFDWEPIEPVDEPRLLDLATQVRAANPDLLLTVPVGWTNANGAPSLAGYAALARVVDQINVMTYGAAGAWTGWKSWHSSALYQVDSATPSSVDASVRAYRAAGVPPGKLGFGIGFYGLCYTFPITGPGQTLTATATLASGGGSLTYATIMERYFEPAARRWDALARVPYLSFGAETGPKGCGFITYDDETSIAEKTAYLKAQGLGGMVVWEINGGHLSNAPEGTRDPLVEALADHLLFP